MRDCMDALPGRVVHNFCDPLRHRCNRESVLFSVLLQDSDNLMSSVGKQSASKYNVLEGPVSHRGQATPGTAA